MIPPQNQANGNKPPFDDRPLIIAINGQLGYAVVLAVVAYWIWPTDPRWYGFGLMSIMMGAAAAALILRSFGQMVKIHRRNQFWKLQKPRGNAPKNARLASDDDMRRGGMK
ncbi:hypothetical protein IWQ54_006470 [Labrenzia sp. EL_195]|nr:hypothetical protein [Labrenzia sp. EL_195]